MNKILTLIAALSVLTSCSHGNQWKVKGKIEGADGQTLFLEAGSNGHWYALDSVTLKQSGNFAFSAPATPYPDIYRLKVGTASFYFPIDSIETLTIEANVANPADMTLSGSETAESMLAVDKLVNAYAAKGNAANETDLKELKKQLAGKMLENPGSIVAYYIINKTIGGKPLFDPADKGDIRIIGAVANAFSDKPGDPRAKYLENLFISNRRKVSTAPTDTLLAFEVPLFEIELFDNSGNKKSLSQTADNNKVVILNFTAYGADFSPVYNVELNKVFEKHHSKGLEIYQISYDADEYQWRQAAKNLPWITVYDPAVTGSKHLAEYNVFAIPTTFVIANGEIAERVEDPTKLDAAVAKHL